MTGASRGIGKGTALALGELGCTVYVTGRTVGDGDLTIDTTARGVTAAGGEGRAICCDHSDDAQIEQLFSTIGARTTLIHVALRPCSGRRQARLAPFPRHHEPLPWYQT